MEVSSCDWHVAPICGVPWPPNSVAVTSSAKLLADLYLQKSNDRLVIEESAVDEFEERLRNGKSKQCRRLERREVTTQRAVVFCVQIFEIATKNRPIRALGRGLTLVGGAAMAGALIAHGLHGLALPAFEWITGGGTVAVAFGGGTQDIPLRKRRKARALPPEVYITADPDAPKNTQAKQLTRPWRTCQSSNGDHATCG